MEKIMSEKPAERRYQTLVTDYAPDDEVNDLLAEGWTVVNVTVLPFVDRYGCTQPNFFVTLIRQEQK
jgi:hypothetical protein